MADDALTRTVPQSVQESMLQLRKDASAARTLKEWRDRGRYATPQEIALSEALRRPTDCAGHSVRTGLACRKPRVIGMNVCRRHGGNLKHVKAKAEERLAKMVDPTIRRLGELSQQDKHLPAAVNASRDILNRAGIGAEIEAKVRSSQRDPNNRIEVHIGFLTHIAPDTPRPVVIDASTVTRSEE